MTQILKDFNYEIHRDGCRFSHIDMLLYTDKHIYDLRQIRSFFCDDKLSPLPNTLTNTFFYLEALKQTKLPFTIDIDEPEMFHFTATISFTIPITNARHTIELNFHNIDIQTMED